MLIAALAAGAAFWLLLPPPRLVSSGVSARIGLRAHVWAGSVAVIALLAAAAGALVSVVVVLAAVLAAGTLAFGLRWFRGRRTRVELRHRRAQVIDICELLASELSAGQPLSRALDRGAQTWPVLAGLAEAERLGLDLPQRMRDLACERGYQHFRHVAAAWQVAQRSGAGLSDAVDRVASSLREDARTQRLVEGELASARATATLVAFLPFAAWAMGSGVGGAPWQFLLTNPIGWGCAGLGLVLLGLGLAWIEALARGVTR